METLNEVGEEGKSINGQASVPEQESDRSRKMSKLYYFSSSRKNYNFLDCDWFKNSQFPRL